MLRKMCIRLFEEAVDIFLCNNIQEATPSQVASAGTLAVAFMETLSTVLLGFTDGNK
jgi:hypothetical protein